MHARIPDEKEHLAALAQHKKRMQAYYYRLHDKVSETDLSRRALKKLVPLKTSETRERREAYLMGKGGRGKTFTTIQRRNCNWGYK